MATFREIMDAAHNADKAGDEAAAARLVEIARGMVPADAAPKPEGEALVLPTLDANDQLVGTATGPKKDRFGDTIAAATKAPVAATRHFAGETVDPSNSFWDRAGAAGMTALSAAGATYAAGAGLAGEMFGGSPTNERKLARDLMMMGEVSLPELAGVSSTMRAASSAGRAAQKLQKQPTEKQVAARAADELGITPSLGMQGKTRAMAAGAFEKFPPTSRRIADDAARAVTEIEDAHAKIVGNIGAAKSAAGAGKELQAGLGKFYENFKARSSELFKAVDAEIPSGTVVPAQNSAAVLTDVLDAFADNPEIAAKLGVNKWAGVAGELEQGLTWEVLSRLRTQVGSAVGKLNGPLSDVDGGQLKRLYGALTADMEAAAKAAGPKAYSQWRRAQNYYKRGAKRAEEHLDRLISADTPERAFELFVDATKGDRKTTNFNRLSAVKKSLGTDEWNDVAASIVERIGQAPSGQQNAAGTAFSPSRFLTEWNKMDPAAKRLLFDGETRSELAKLARVAEMSKKANLERNFSNTGTVEGWIAFLGGLQVAPATTAATSGGIYLSARAMTNKTMLRAMNKAARGDTRALRAIARGNSPYAQDAASVLRLSAAEAAGVGQPANLNSEFQSKAVR